MRETNLCSLTPKYDQRQADTGWKPPVLLTNALEKLDAQISPTAGEQQDEKAVLEDIRNLIRVRNGTSFVIAVCVRPFSLLCLSSHF